MLMFAWIWSYVNTDNASLYYEHAGLCVSWGWQSLQQGSMNSLTSNKWKTDLQSSTPAYLFILIKSPYAHVSTGLVCVYKARFYRKSFLGNFDKPMFPALLVQHCKYHLHSSINGSVTQQSKTENTYAFTAANWKQL